MAEVKPSYDTNRKKLRDVVPLNSPLSMYIEPTRKCNLKCFYCMHSTRGNENGVLAKTGFKLEDMDMDLYKKIVKDIMAFPNKTNRVCFSGLGDPLMNPRLPEMAKILRDAGFTARIDVITNGLLLTPTMSEALVEAGVNRIQISVQALTSERNREICGVPVDMEKYIQNIEYLYKNKKNTEIFIKIIDANLSGGEEKDRFFNMFSHICDTIFVEHLVIMEQQMGDHGGKVDATRNLNNEIVEKRFCCGVMFYFLQINIDGDTYPCSTPGLPTAFSMGNVRDNTLVEIWNAGKRNELIRKNLSIGYAKIPACAKCSSCIAIADDTEYVDDCREELLERFPARG